MSDEIKKDQAHEQDLTPEQAGEEKAAPAEAEISQEEARELKDRLLRALAEVENVRRQKAREVEETSKYAVSRFARELLEVADNLSRALASVPVEERTQNELMTSLVSGIELTERTLMGVFERNKIAKVTPEKGAKFDHNLHQAMFEVPTAELPSGSIAEVMQPGYVIADRLLRPAMVGVAKAPAKPAEAASGSSGASVDTKV
ncbi:nucleotide exchange factor GrpE [Geminicoccaceae bacterium 1502E]|nr:nucleotide exchange factor GrpE [Geminicoccaceae bacterium 1502E]